MLAKVEVINYYRTLRRYRDHDTVMVLLKEHFWFKVSGQMTRQAYEKRVTKIIANNFSY